MSDVAAFVRARLDEWENVAFSVPEVEPKSNASVFTSLHVPTGTVEMSPARVLAQVAAMRAIVDRYEHLSAAFLCDPGELDVALAAVHDLAAIWRDHDQYDPAWAPDA